MEKTNNTPPPSQQQPQTLTAEQRREEEDERIEWRIVKVERGIQLFGRIVGYVGNSLTYPWRALSERFLNWEIPEKLQKVLTLNANGKYDAKIKHPDDLRNILNYPHFLSWIETLDFTGYTQETSPNDQWKNYTLPSQIFRECKYLKTLKFNCLTKETFPQRVVLPESVERVEARSISDISGVNWSKAKLAEIVCDEYKAESFPASSSGGLAVKLTHINKESVLDCRKHMGLESIEVECLEGKLELGENPRLKKVVIKELKEGGVFRISGKTEGLKEVELGDIGKGTRIELNATEAEFKLTLGRMVPDDVMFLIKGDQSIGEIRITAKSQNDGEKIKQKIANHKNVIKVEPRWIVNLVFN